MKERFSRYIAILAALMMISSMSIYAGNIYIGKDASAALTIPDPHRVTNANAVMGDSANGIGTVTVDGHWTINGNLTNGNIGMGTLNLNPGSEVTVTGTYSQNSSSSLVLTVDGTTTPTFNVSGVATLKSGSTIKIKFKDNIVPDSGTNLTLFTAGTITDEGVVITINQENVNLVSTITGTTLSIIVYNGPIDTDLDGVPDSTDAFPDDPAAAVDSDGDGYPNAFLGNATQLVNGNGIDAFPDDSSESVDTDGDGVGDNSDIAPNDAQLSEIDYAPAEDLYASVAFEDLWPETGDYDFNDMIVDYRYTYHKVGSNVTRIKLELAIESSASYQNGLGIELPVDSDNIASITGLGTLTEMPGIELNANNTEAGHPDSTSVIILTTNQFIDSQNTLNVVITFTNAVPKASLGDAPHNMFILSNKSRGREVHMAGESPTAKASSRWMNSGNDNTNVNVSGQSYKTTDNHPWAIHLAERFKPPKEGEDISQVYKKFKDWAQNNTHVDWYTTDSSDYRNNTKIRQTRKRHE